MRASSRPKVMILGSGPNRIGQGIEFDYCCVHASFALSGRGLRDDHGELQSRDGVHRLRHERPPLLRAPHARRRAQRDRGRAPRLGDRCPRRADPFEAGRRAAGGADRRYEPRVDRRRRGPRTLELALRPSRDPPTGGRHRVDDPTGARYRRTRRLSGARPAELRARRPGHADRLRRRRTSARPWPSSRTPARSAAREGSRPNVRCSSTASSRTPSKSMSTPSATRTGEVLIGGVMEHVEEAGVHSGDSACVLPPPTLGPPGHRP